MFEAVTEGMVVGKAVVEAVVEVVTESIAAKAIEEETVERVEVRVIAIGSIGIGGHAAPAWIVLEAIGACVLCRCWSGREQAQADPAGEARWDFHCCLQKSQPLRCFMWEAAAPGATLSLCH